jgi:hypothetical protein
MSLWRKNTRKTCCARHRVDTSLGSCGLPVGESAPGFGTFIRDLCERQGIKTAPVLVREVSRLSKIRSSWPLGGVGLVAIAIALLAAPARIEGPVLLPISPGHAISALDSFAVVPLLIGTGWLQAGLWKRRERLYETIRVSPAWGSLGVFVAGVGLGLLLASVFPWFWWWAVGAILFGAMMISALMTATRRAASAADGQRYVLEEEYLAEEGCVVMHHLRNLKEGEHRWNRS